MNVYHSFHRSSRSPTSKHTQGAFSREGVASAINASGVGVVSAEDIPLKDLKERAETGLDAL